MMNSVERYLYGEKEQWKENQIDRAQNENTQLCGRVYRFVAEVSSQVSRRSNLVFRECLVIDLNNQIKRVVIAKPLGDQFTFEEHGRVFDVRGVHKRTLKNLYAFFYTLNQIKENEGNN